MAMPGVMASVSVVCPSPRCIITHSSATSFSSSSSSSSSSSDRRILSLSSSTSSFGGRGTSTLLRRGHRGFTLGRPSRSSDGAVRSDATERGPHVVRAVKESGTLEKDAPGAAAGGGGDDDSSVRSQGAATIYGDDSILDEKKIMAEDEEEMGGDGIRPLVKRFNFDYGFQAKFLRTGPTVPPNVFLLALENFVREWRALRRSYLFRELKPIKSEEVKGGVLGLISAYAGRGAILLIKGADKFLTLYDGLSELKPVKQEVNEEQEELRAQLKKLVLSNEKVWARENARPPVHAPWWILAPYYFLCLMLDVIFDKRPIQRFWFLETVARMPYFSYISMLHLYETLGWWRSGAEVRKVHFAEEWNEMHHLKIMESLGGDLEWGDRFFGQHAAFFYYWVLNIMFLISPRTAYNFSELIESHAVDTYGEFADANKELLKTLPPPPTAVAYYESKDLYMFDEFQTSHLPEERRPRMNSLHDVFLAITGDEWEHVKTMIACQELHTQVISPHRMQKMHHY